jgi:hypothetical protein
MWCDYHAQIGPLTAFVSWYTRRDTAQHTQTHKHTRTHTQGRYTQAVTGIRHVGLCYICDAKNALRLDR